MRRSLVSSLLSLLLLTTFVWGGCMSCEQYFMFGGGKSCCTPDGHCKRKAPASHQNPTQDSSPDANRDCRQIAYDHQKSFDLHIDLPVTALARIELPLRAIPVPNDWRRADLIEPSPPDLQVLHSVFLI